MTGKEYEELLAIELFKKEEHVDPSDAADFDAKDFGWSKLDLQVQDLYRSIANHIHIWMVRNPSPLIQIDEQSYIAGQSALIDILRSELDKHDSRS